MSYQVFLTRDAVRDLEEIDEYLAASDSEAKADYVLDKIGAVLQSRLLAVWVEISRLSWLPWRGKGHLEPLTHIAFVQR